MPTMPIPDGISSVQEQILLSLWKHKAIGKTIVDEETLLRDAVWTGTTRNDWAKSVESLRGQGFLEASNNKEGRGCFSLTPLGLAILRKIEEDRLQELK